MIGKLPQNDLENGFVWVRTQAPLKVHNCISTKMELWNNKHPLLFVWPTENVLRGKKKMHCVAKNTDVCTNVQSPLIWRGGRKT